MGVVEVAPCRSFTPNGEGGIGVHLLLDLYEVPVDHLMDAQRLQNALTAAATAAGLTCLAEPFLYRFPNGGLTGFLPLAESHIAFHTYPEFAYLAADIFTCGAKEAADRAAEVFCAAIVPGRIERQQQTRGEECGL